MNAAEKILAFIDIDKKLRTDERNVLWSLSLYLLAAVFMELSLIFYPDTLSQSRH